MEISVHLRDFQQSELQIDTHLTQPVSTLRFEYSIYSPKILNTIFINIFFLQENPY